MLVPPHPALRKNRVPRPAKSKTCPVPQKLTKPAGRNGAKLTIDYTDYALPFGLRVGKCRKSFFIWSFVQLVIFWFAERPFKSQRI